MISLENKNKQLENEILTIKQENQNILSSKTKKHDINLNKVNISLFYFNSFHNTSHRLMKKIPF